MKRKILYLVLSLVLILSSTIFILPVSADSGKKVKIGDTQILDGGYVSTCIGYNDNGVPEWQVDLGTPTYLEDKITRIDTTWHLVNGKYVSGDNKFTANVNGSSISLISKKDSSNIAWSPTVSVSNVFDTDNKTKQAITNGAKSGIMISKNNLPTLLAVDPINSNYVNNTLEWDLGNGIYRRLRLIEGMCLEYYIITKPINGDFNILSNIIKSLNFNADRKAVAWDADYKPVDITTDLSHNIKLGSDKYYDDKIKYPITIDPDMTFETTASDANLYLSRVGTWAGARTNSTASSVDSSSYHIIQENYSSHDSSYEIERVSLYFDTSSIPDSVNITNAVLSIYTGGVVDGTTPAIYIVSGMPTYPHDPTVVGDFDYTNYGSFAGNYGYSNALTAGGYRVLNSNNANALKGIVNKTGYTKLLLIGKYDYGNTAPTSSTGEYITFYGYEGGSGVRPKLVVTYTATTPSVTAITASSIAKSSARLNSQITNDGSDPNACQVRFGYGTVSQTAVNFNSYATISSWSSDNYSTGDYPYLDVSSLTASTTYYFRVQVRNSSTNSTSSNEISFATLSGVSSPTNFNGLPTDTTISLNWVIGSGSSNTQVVVSTSGYPTNNSTGTVIYTGGLSVFNYTGLTAGTTYYFSAWGYSGSTWSSPKTTLVMSTLPTGASGISYSTPSAPFNWDSSPLASHLQNLEPFYSIINNVFTSVGMDINIGWLALFMLFTFLVGFVILIKTHSFAGAGWVVFGFLIIGSLIGLLPMYFAFIMIGINLGAYALKYQFV